MPRPLRICLINPRSRPSYWTADYAMPFHSLGRGVRYSMANGALVAVAALVPPGHTVELLDENVEPIDFERLRDFDVVGVTGMAVQSARLLEILHRLRGLGPRIAVGGPFATVHESSIEGLCDVRFIGEAEETWPAWIEALAEGRPTAARYQQAGRTDMTRVPVPRFDLLRLGAYASVPVQFSRGCPFLCEFCDIITIFGRRPRTKAPAQVLAELDALRAAGFRGVFLVDDNFIGNKVEAKKLLRHIAQWQRERGHPLSFVTEASINLADDAELLALMVEAGLTAVFVGIETPRAASLSETRKVQNVRGDSMLDKVRRIRAAGVGVSGGFIVGFDSDDADIFDEQYEFIQASGIATLSIGLLTPLPTTPLYDRLRAEGRLDFSDPELPFHPRQMTREQLKAGFRLLLGRVFHESAFFDRVFEAARTRRPGRAAPRRGPLGLAVTLLRSGATAVRAVLLVATLARHGLLRRAWREHRRVRQRNAALGARAFGVAELVGHWITWWHFSRVTREIAGTAFAGAPAPAGEAQPIAR